MRSATDSTVTFGRLVGVMLGARLDRAYARGSGREAGVDETERLWRWRVCSRLATADRTTTTGPGGTRIERGGRVVETAPVPMSGWIGWTDRLLVPAHLLIWGRPGEDWHLSSLAGSSSEIDGAVVVAVEHMTDGREGEAHVLAESGHVMLLDLPGFVRWQIDELDLNPQIETWPVDQWFEGLTLPDRSD